MTRRPPARACRTTTNTTTTAAAAAVSKRGPKMLPMLASASARSFPSWRQRAAHPALVPQRARVFAGVEV